MSFAHLQADHVSVHLLPLVRLMLTSFSEKADLHLVFLIIRIRNLGCFFKWVLVAETLDNYADIWDRLLCCGSGKGCPVLEKQWTTMWAPCEIDFVSNKTFLYILLPTVVITWIFSNNYFNNLNMVHTVFHQDLLYGSSFLITSSQNSVFSMNTGEKCNSLHVCKCNSYWEQKASPVSESFTWDQVCLRFRLFLSVNSFPRHCTHQKTAHSNNSTLACSARSIVYV